jgi:alpha-beta hydrolase superfamily lysophospholipase
MPNFEYRLQTEDGLSLYGQGWETQAAPGGVVSLVHGLGEHSGRYAHLASFLNDHGYALLSFDLRGHGKSPGPRGHTPDYEALMSDISSLLEETARRYPSLPVFLYGHSMGGNLVLNYALRRRPEITGVIATDPFLRLAFEPPALQIALGNLMNRIAPAFSQANGLDTKALSRNPEVVRRYENDPLVHDRISARLFTSLYRSGLWALEHAGEFPLPLLLMHGSADRITSVQATREFASKVGENATLKVWEGFYHEIHNEPEQEQVFHFLLDWMNRQVQKI